MRFANDANQITRKFWDAVIFGRRKKTPEARTCGAFILEADVGIEPAYTDLQSAA